MELKFEVRGMAEIQAMLEKLGSLDITALLGSIGTELQEISRENIDRRTSPSGEPMKEWSAAYERIAARDVRRDILRGARPRLRASIAWQIKDGDLYYGSSMVYAGVHQFGWPERNIPARPYLGIGSRERRGIEDTLQGFMEGIGL